MSNKVPVASRGLAMEFIILLINYLFAIITIELVIAAFFWKDREGRLFFLNGVLLLGISMPYFSMLSAVFHTYPKPLFFATALFPLSYVMLLKSFVKTGRGRWTLAIPAALSAIFLSLSIVYTGMGVVFLSLLSIAFSLYLFYLLFTSIFTSKTMYMVLQIATVIHLLLSAASLRFGDGIYCTTAMLMLFTITSVLFVLSYFKKIARLSKYLKLNEETNRQLNHTITRLKLKIELLGQVIQQKELELLQMSKHASLAEITAGIAHELAQPLTGIKGIAQNMMDDINYDEFEKLQAVSELMKICTLVDKSSSIIDHIRNFSKKNGMNMQFIDINKVILNAIDLVNIQFKKYDIDVVLMLNENVKRIYGDTISLELLIINLLINARDAILERRRAESEHTGKITIISDSLPEGVNLIIEDNGTGIPQEIIKKIWSPFFTTKRKSNSTGIGLSISNKILREHNAEVRLESSPGSGSRFIVLFPVRRENQVIAVS